MQEIRVLVCDDEELIHQKVEELIKTYDKTNEYVFKVFHCYNGEELISFSIEYDVLMLDIDMPDKDGIEAARILLKNGYNPQIIMLSSKRERFKDAFKIGAKRFVTKPVNEKEFYEALSAVIYSWAGSGLIEVSNNGEKCTISQREIKYIESKKDYLKIYTYKTDFEINESLKIFMEKLDQRIFLQSHRSKIVNLLYVLDMDKEWLYLNGGEKIPVSRRKYKEVHQKIIEFDKNWEG